MIHMIKNTFTAYGSGEDLHRLTRKLREPDSLSRTENSPFLLWNIVKPSNPNSMGYSTETKKLLWNLKNWGTTAEVSDVARSETVVYGQWTVTFVSEWRPPYEALARLSGIYKNLIFKHTWSESQNATAGGESIYEKGLHIPRKPFGVSQSHRSFEKGGERCLCNQGYNWHPQFPFFDCPSPPVSTKDALRGIELAERVVNADFL